MTSVVRLLHRAALVIGGAVIAACGTDRPTSPAGAGSVEVSPAAWTFLALQDTVRFEAVVLDAAGAPVGGNALPLIRWSTSDTSVAMVDANGVATAVGNGTAIISARTDPTIPGTGAEATVAQEGHSLAIARQPQDGTAGWALPVQPTVSVQDANGYVVTTDSHTVVNVTVTPASGVLEGTVEVTAQGGTASFTDLTIRGAPGDYAFVFSSPRLTPASSNVFAMLPAPSIAISASDVEFTAGEGLGDPPAHSVQVTDGSGRAALADLTLGTIVYGPGATNWLTANLDGPTVPATLTLQATTGNLLPAAYTATVPIESSVASGGPQSVTVTFTVAPIEPNIALDPASTNFTAIEGGAAPPASTVAVENAGFGSTPLTDLRVGAITYAGGAYAWLTTATLSGSNAPATLTLQPNTGNLPSGTYTATVPIESSVAENSPQNVSVTFTVNPQPTIALDVSALTFAGPELGADPALQVIDVTNGTTTPVSLTDLAIGSISYGGGSAGWLGTLALSSTEAPAQITVQPKTGNLLPGTYTATFAVESPVAANTPQSVTVTFTVQPIVPTITVNPSNVPVYAFVGGADPPALQLPVDNAGVGSTPLTNLSIGTITYAGGAGGWVTSAWLSGTAAPATLTLQTETGSLSPGTYTATVPIESPVAANSPYAVTVSFTVYALGTSIWPTNGWPMAPPVAMGMDEAKLIQARDYALNTNNGGGAGVITRHGRIVMAWGDTHKRYDIKSSTKSIGSTILGLAVRDGLLSLSDPAQQHHPGIGVPPDSNNATGWLDDITILELATQTAGFEKSGGYTALFYEPGTAWYYSDGGPNWLAEAITLAYGQDLRSILTAEIMSPLGVSSGEYAWRSNQYRNKTIQGIQNREFGSGISTSVDAMARIGYLYLRDGSWDGALVVQSSYVATASAPIPSVVGLPSLTQKYPTAPSHYGLLWWNNADGVMPGIPTDAFFSSGLLESFIIVIPSLDIVIARAGPRGWRTDTSKDFLPVLEPFLTFIVESVTTP